MRGLGPWFLGVTLLLHSGVVCAQTDQERAAARSLATEGINAYSAGRNAEALDKLERAYQLAPIPTIGLWSARALEKAGKLVEANERLIAVGRFQITHDESGVFAQAKAEAEQMQTALEPRVPELRIELQHAEGLEYKVELDGQTLNSALVNVPFQANPGNHSVVARVGASQVKKDVAIVERGSTHVTLDLAVLRPAPSVDTPPTSAAAIEPHESNPGAPAMAPVESSGASGKHIAGWVVLGFGGAGLITGGVLGAKAIEQHSLYEDRCPNGKCSSAYQDYYDTFQKNQTYAFVAGGIGVVAVGAGLYLLLSSDGKSGEHASVQPYFGWGSVGAVGQF